MLMLEPRNEVILYVSPCENNHIYFDFFFLHKKMSKYIDIALVNHNWKTMNGYDYHEHSAYRDIYIYNTKHKSYIQSQTTQTISQIYHFLEWSIHCRYEPVLSLKWWMRRDWKPFNIKHKSASDNTAFKTGKKCCGNLLIGQVLQFTCNFFSLFLILQHTRTELYIFLERKKKSNDFLPILSLILYSCFLIMYNAPCTMLDENRTNSCRFPNTSYFMT